MSLLVDSVGALATVQDLGRPGHAVLGVPRGGALDRGALRLANRLVGNQPGAAGLEILLGGLSLHADADHLVAVTGAPVGLLRDGAPMPFGEPVRLRAGQSLELGRPTTGMRSYLAVRGGLAGDRLFGSLSTDPVNGLGAEPLAPGGVLEVEGSVAGPPGGADVVPSYAVPPGGSALRVVLGPREDWLERTDDLVSSPWRASTEMDRVGLRLDGPALRRRPGELPSEPVVPGSVQVPPGGRPVVFLADHPTTGGYPVVAVVVDADLDLLGQLRPGDAVRLRPVQAGLRGRAPDA